MKLQVVLNSGDSVKFWQSENDLLFLRCFIRYVPSGDGFLFGNIYIYIIRAKI